MATKIYKIFYPSGREEQIMLFQKREQDKLEKDLPRMQSEGLIRRWIVQDPSARRSA